MKTTMYSLYFTALTHYLKKNFYYLTMIFLAGIVNFGCANFKTIFEGAYSPSPTLSDDSRTNSQDSTADLPQHTLDSQLTKSEEPSPNTPIVGNAKKGTLDSLPTAKTPIEELPISATQESTERLVLNFNNAEIHKVIKVLSEVLDIDYLIDPKVKGTVNLHMKGEIEKSDLLSMFQDIIRINRAAIMKVGPLHHILPMTATTNTHLPIITQEYNADRNGARGESVGLHIVPIHHISTTELEKVIKPFLSQGSHIATYANSRLLLFTDHADNAVTIRSLIKLFDTNIFEQVTVRLYPIRRADVTEIAQELEKIFSAFELPTKSGIGVGVSLLPIPRTNILLVLSSITESFDLVEHWLAQLDKETGSTETRTYIYHVKNGIAEELSEILNSIFEQTEASTGQVRTAALTATPSQETPFSGPQGEITGEIKIIPYPTTNTLIIKANPRDWDTLQGILHELDIMPRQVLIEVLVAEVTLTENLEYGVAYSFLNNENPVEPRLRGSTTGTLRADVLTIDAGERVNLLAQLRAHDDESVVRVLASPHLLVTDGKEASLEIGDEISIRTAVSEGAGVEPGAAEATVRKDTGTILKVTPIINATGLVTMDLDLEKSNVGPPAVGSTDVSISKRQAVTSMVVHDGETILVGGLIDESERETIVKVPILGDIPYIGALFRNTIENKSRIELVLLITPRVIKGISDATEATEEFFSKVNAIQNLMASRGY